MDTESKNLNNNGYKIITAILLAIVVILSLWSLFLLNWNISIDIESVPDQIMLGENLTAPGAKLNGKILFRNGFDLPVKVYGEINSNVVGRYTLQYSANWLFYECKLSKTIDVVDLTPPTIELTEQEGHYTPPGKKYEEEGYQAIDNFDGDITDKVKIFINEDIVTYFVQDSSGNTAIKERVIDRGDIEPPVIEILGPKELTINQGTSYFDDGAKAFDNVDGEISSRIKIENNVNTSVAGTYTITYTVVDSFYNQTQAIRTVNVISVNNQQTETSDIGKGRTIYLTFDDGPSAYTPELLKILKTYNVKATFFVVGNTGYTDYIQDIVNDGHSIGIHSVTHKYSEIYANEEAFFNDLYNMQNIIKEKSGVETYLMRFPGGSSNTVSKSYNQGIMTRLCEQVQEKGFVYFDWNVSSGDAGGAKTTEQVVNNVIKGIKNNKKSIVLQHDNKKFSVDAVEQIIQWALANGYTFAPLDMNSYAAHHGVNN